MKIYGPKEWWRDKRVHFSNTKNNKLCTLDILFSSNHNIHKSSHGLCFWASDPLIDKFYKNLSIKGSEAQKQRPNEIVWMLWFDEKSISNVYTYHCCCKHVLT